METLGLLLRIDKMCISIQGRACQTYSTTLFSATTNRRLSTLWHVQRHGTLFCPQTCEADQDHHQEEPSLSPFQELDIDTPPGGRHPDHHHRPDAKHQKLHQIDDLNAGSCNSNQWSPRKRAGIEASSLHHATWPRLRRGRCDPEGHGTPRRRQGLQTQRH